MDQNIPDMDVISIIDDFVILLEAVRRRGVPTVADQNATLR
jgi:hypothetical protein